MTELLKERTNKERMKVRKKKEKKEKKVRKERYEQALVTNALQLLHFLKRRLNHT